VEGTLAKMILSEPEEITTMSGQKLPLKMSVDYISFSAHTDYQQTRDFIKILKPPQIVSFTMPTLQSVKTRCLNFQGVGSRGAERNESFEDCTHQGV
jgi:Cft2 family RNA processing exonuclease